MGKIIGQSGNDIRTCIITRLRYLVRVDHNSMGSDLSALRHADLSPCCRYWHFRGSITNGIAGGGIAEIRERGFGNFSFGKLTVNFL